MKTVAFFGIKGGTGKTTIVYHLAWMLAKRGLRVVMADLDPQANLTLWSLGEERTQALWQQDTPQAISSALMPVMQGEPSSDKPFAGHRMSERLMILPGDLELIKYEGALSNALHDCRLGPQSMHSLRVANALNEFIRCQAEAFQADVVLLDLASNLGAINRAALIATDCVVFPLIPSQLSVHGLATMGNALREWRATWAAVKDRLPSTSPIDTLASGDMRPIGYILSHLSFFKDRLEQADAHSVDAIAAAYAKYVSGGQTPPSGTESPDCLGQIKNYPSLARMAYEAHKPMFMLRPADGALGGHQRATQDAYHVFRLLAERIADRIGLELPDA